MYARMPSCWTQTGLDALPIKKPSVKSIPTVTDKLNQGTFTAEPCEQENKENARDNSTQNMTTADEPVELRDSSKLDVTDRSVDGVKEGMSSFLTAKRGKCQLFMLDEHDLSYV